MGTHNICLYKEVDKKYIGCNLKIMKFLNCAMGTHNICLYKEVDKKYIGCNLKIMKLLDYALIGVCTVFKSNTVVSIWIQK